MHEDNDKTQPRYCPECQATLEHKQFKVFHAWVCPQGHGTLYPKGELQRIVSAVSGVGEVKLGIWSERSRFSVVESPLISPESNRPMLEIRDKEFSNIIIYGDQDSHSIWVHTGDEEKLVEYVRSNDDIGAYVSLAASNAAKLLFDDDESLSEAAHHTVVAFKLLGERLLRALPHIAF